MCLYKWQNKIYSWHVVIELDQSFHFDQESPLTMSLISKTVSGNPHSPAMLIHSANFCCYLIGKTYGPPVLFKGPFTTLLSSPCNTKHFYGVPMRKAFPHCFDSFFQCKFWIIFVFSSTRTPLIVMDHIAY